MNEKDIIDYVRTLTRACHSEVIDIGPGDDAAGVLLQDGGVAILSTDMLIEGVHFKPGAPPDKVGAKAIGRALSDLAAMASKPACSLAAVSLPSSSTDSYIKALYRGMQEEAERLGAPLAGGDTGSGTAELIITVTVVGTCGPRGTVRRSGARPGDSICVTGALGGALRGRHMTPEPRICEALELAENYDLHSMIDISDGLSTDLLHIAQESGVGVSINACAIPIHQDASAIAQHEGSGTEGAVLHALSDGEDYELLFTLPPMQAEKLASGGLSGVNVSIIGSIRKCRAKTITWPDATETTLKDTGWHHLKNK